MEAVGAAVSKLIVHVVLWPVLGPSSVQLTYHDLAPSGREALAVMVVCVLLATDELVP